MGVEGGSQGEKEGGWRQREREGRRVRVTKEAKGRKRGKEGEKGILRRQLQLGVMCCWNNNLQKVQLLAHLLHVNV
jgi:hypothetical protein